MLSGVFFKSIFYVFLIFTLAILYSHLLGKDRVVLEAGFIFDTYICILTLYALTKLKKVGVDKLLFRFFILWSFLFFLFLFHALFLEQDFVLFQFLRSIRFVVYILFLLIVYNYYLYCDRSKNQYGYRFLFVALSVLFFLVYCYKFFFLGYTRSWLFSENNFEMAMMAVFSAICMSCFAGKFKYSTAVPIFVFLAAVLSFSKSAVLEWVVIVFRKMSGAGNALKFMFFCVFCVSSYVFYWIFVNRLAGASIGDIDRFIFLKVFFIEYTSGGLFNMLFGYGPAYNLDLKSCVTLSFWVDSMFEGDGFCNASVFHSLFMRLVFEYGIIVFSFFLYTWWKILTYVWGRSLGLTVFLILSVSSLSVSGFSNAIIVFPLFFMASFTYSVSKN